jgi:phosphoribosylanthranilate isomerase
MLVKICGITNLKDAAAAAEMGADMIGFIFAKSQRRISPEKAAEIIRRLEGNILKVGVFVDETGGTVEKTAKFCGLDFVQLHGNETREYANRLSLPFIKAFKVSDESVVREIQRFRAEISLLDAYVPGISGGTGKRIDMQILKEAVKNGKVLVAGGLNPENVAEVISRVHPFGVDVSSGVEYSPGKKNYTKMERFIMEAKK